MGNAKGTREERRAAAIARIGYDQKRWNEIERALSLRERHEIVDMGYSVAEWVTMKVKQEMETKQCGT